MFSLHGLSGKAAAGEGKKFENCSSNNKTHRPFTPAESPAHGSLIVVTLFNTTQKRELGSITGKRTDQSSRPQRPLGRLRCQQDSSLRPRKETPGFFRCFSKMNVKYRKYAIM